MNDGRGPKAALRAPSALADGRRDVGEKQNRREKPGDDERARGARFVPKNPLPDPRARRPTNHFANAFRPRVRECRRGKEEPERIPFSRWRRSATAFVALLEATFYAVPGASSVLSSGPD